MGSGNGKTFDDLTYRVARKFQALINGIRATRDFENLLYVNNIIDDATARFRGVKPCAVPRPSEGDVNAFLSRVIAESRERGGELTL
jgi:hypothetical protein